MSENDCKYVRDYYGVPACIGRIVTYKGKTGIIDKDGGNYISVNFDCDKPGVTCNIHPKDESLVYGGIGKVRKMTRGKQNYAEYIRSEVDCSFAEWMGFKP